MENAGNYLALDFGAESGRAIIVTIDQGRATLEEIHRFPNSPVLLNGTLSWDLPFLFNEIINSLKIARSRGVELKSLAVDTWGVDFGLLDRDDQLIGNPVHYRDGRTGDAKNNSPVDDLALFELSGGFPWNIGSLFQLRSMMTAGLDSLKRSATFLNMPDLFNFLLCGEKRSEVTIASTSLMMDRRGVWSKEIVEKFGLPSIFPSLVEPGALLGELRGDLAELTGYEGLKVMTTCSHDTASVAAVVPDREEISAFLSCGTWSILGKINNSPVTSPTLLEAGFTNEASLDSWYLCKNITGLYPFQELKREWELTEDPWDYGKMCAEADKAESAGFVDLELADFQTPGNMTARIERHLNRPVSRGEAAKVLLDSLALEYALNLKNMSDLTKSPVERLYMLGGGIKNTYLCRRTAELCGIPVIAGIDQGTALGNGLVQAYGLGDLDSPGEIREIAAASFTMDKYDMGNDEYREEIIGKYRELKEKNHENE